MTDRNWTETVRDARGDDFLAVLEGYHPLKHALWFEADILDVVTDDLEPVLALSRHFSPDLTDAIERAATIVPKELYPHLFREGRRTDVLAIARRRIVSADEVLNADRQAPLVLLEEPSHHGNIGATIRVAASAGAAGVVTTGLHDPWHSEAIRGAAGLHFAVPVARSPVLGDHRGPLVAFEPTGDDLRLGDIPDEAVLAFGSERRGLSKELLARADQCVRIPMHSKVSSMNLASAVAVGLYVWRLAQ